MRRFLCVLGVVAATSSTHAADIDVQLDLLNDGVGVTETCDFRVEVFDDAVGGASIGGPHLISTVDVDAGLATFGLPDADLWSGIGDPHFQVEVRCAGDSGFELLPDRFAVGKVPVALSAMETKNGPSIGSVSFVDASLTATTVLASVPITVSDDGFVVVEFSGTIAVGVNIDLTDRQDCSFDFSNTIWGGYELVLELDDGVSTLQSSLFKQSARRITMPADENPVSVQCAHTFNVPAGSYVARVVGTPHIPPSEPCNAGAHGGLTATLTSGEASGTLVATTYGQH